MLTTVPARGADVAAYTPRRRPLFGPRMEGALNLLVVVFLLPLAIGSAVRRWLVKNRPLPAAPLREVAGSGTPLVDVASFALEAEHTDARPRFGWGSLDFQLQYAPDLVASLLDLSPVRAGRLSACPQPFREVRLTSLDGTPLCGHVATWDGGPRPGLVVAHGTFGSAGQSLYLDAAIEAFVGWGFNVLALDLRTWGRSAALSDAVNTCGWREAEDVLAAARYLLEETDTTTVGAVGYSLGGASVLIAASHELAPDLLRGGVFSESGFAAAKDEVEHLARRPSFFSPDFLAHWIFRIGFGAKFRATGLRGMDLVSYPERVVAPRMGVGIDELWDRASVVSRVRNVKVPAFHLHAEDDWIVPVAHAVALREAAAGNPRVGVCILPRGGHCAFDRVWNGWHRELMRRFFSAAAGVELRERQSDPPGIGTGEEDF